MALLRNDDMRIIGLDLGGKRIGVAAADDRTQIALPVRTIDAEGDPIAAIESLIEEQNADELVVGLPLSMTGAMGPQAQMTMEVVDRLRERIALPVHTWDERLTTAQASRSTPRRGRMSEKRKGVRDAIAATILLQAFLDNRRTPRA
jgi:putative holliday junction resolvase